MQLRRLDGPTINGDTVEFRGCCCSSIAGSLDYAWAHMSSTQGAGVHERPAPMWGQGRTPLAGGVTAQAALHGLPPPQRGSDYARGPHRSFVGAQLQHEPLLQGVQERVVRHIIAPRLGIQRIVLPAPLRDLPAVGVPQLQLPLRPGCRVAGPSLHGWHRAKAGAERQRCSALPLAVEPAGQPAARAGVSQPQTRVGSMGQLIAASVAPESQQQDPSCAMSVRCRAQQTFGGEGGERRPAAAAAAPEAAVA